MKWVWAIQGKNKIGRGEVGPSFNKPLQTKKLLSACCSVSAFSISDSTSTRFDLSLSFQSSVMCLALSCVKHVSEEDLSLPAIARFAFWNILWHHHICLSNTMNTSEVLSVLARNCCLLCVKEFYSICSYSKKDAPTKRQRRKTR